MTKSLNHTTRSSSSSESSAWEILGFNVASERDLSSVPYRCLANLGRSGWMRVRQVNTTRGPQALTAT